MPLERFAAEVERLRDWARTVLPEQRYGEWECDYANWPDLYDAWRRFLSVRPPNTWTTQQATAALFALARDNECEVMVSDLETFGGAAVARAAEFAISIAEPDAKWQIADALGRCEKVIAESLLVRFAADDDEYVRRRAIQSLARIGSASTEAIALEEWKSARADMPWTRMNVLWALHRVRSPHLSHFLRHAGKDPNEHLRAFARRVAAGDVDP